LYIYKLRAVSAACPWSVQAFWTDISLSAGCSCYIVAVIWAKE